MAKKLHKSKIKFLLQEKRHNSLTAKALMVAKDYLDNLKQELKVEKMILFGSAARGEMDKDSDIDLIIVSPDFKKMDFPERLLFLSRLRKGKSRSSAMDIFGYTPQEFKNSSKKRIILEEAKEEGIIIS